MPTGGTRPPDRAGIATIRALHREDAAALQRNCYPGTPLQDVQDYVAWCLHPSRQAWITRLVAEVGGQVVGNAQLTVWGETGEIGSLIVADGFRRQGLGRQLISALIAKARARGLVEVEIQVRQDRPAVVDFYRRLGFEACRPQKNGLSHPACPEPLVRLRMRLQGR